jgi:iron(III) transport system substrate-binding protein
MQTSIKHFAVFLTCLLAAPSVLAQSSDWQKTWDETVAAAKKEGKLIIAGTPKPTTRNEIVPKFMARYGIPVEFIAGRSGDIAERTRVERAAGIYSLDVYLAGADTMFNVLYPDKFIDPLKPLMILPEVADGSKWKGGKAPFTDPEGQYVLRPFNSVESMVYINADYVKPEEMRAAKDLLNPKWKGKISTEDPTVDSGAGSIRAVLFHTQLGADFTRKLYRDQQPRLSRDRREMIDWLARGTAPICLTCRADDAEQLQKEGFKLVEVYDLSDLENFVTSPPFLLAVANKAPHPNAARVFANWIASKEGLELYSRSYGAATNRTDVDESFLDPRVLPRPGVHYIDDSDPAWRSGAKLEAGKEIRAIMKGP